MHVPLTLTFEPDKNTGSLSMPMCGHSITGETRDFSSSGISFQVASIRMQEFYLVGEGRTLKAEIGLPSGIVRMRILGQRYEQVGEHLSVTQYLVGATIVDMSERDQSLYDEFLSGKKERAGSLQLGIEKT